MKKRKNIKFLTHSAVIAALYVILTLVTNIFNLSSGVIQVRISEALTILPVFTPAAIPGLFVGCIISNSLTPGVLIPDIIFGSIATLIGAYFTYLLRKKPLLAPVPPILSNTIIIPFILRYVYCFPGSLPYFMVTVGIGEIISCGVLGLILMHYLKNNKEFSKKVFK